jgi:hypothetical protein
MQEILNAILQLSQEMKELKVLLQCLRKSQTELFKESWIDRRYLLPSISVSAPCKHCALRASYPSHNSKVNVSTRYRTWKQFLKAIISATKKAKAMINENEILRITHYGLNIYAHILRKYYPEEVVLELSGRQCKHARNPFNNNLHSLNICNREGVFCHQDIENPDFKGNPFDFAALHYGLTGQGLLEKLNDEMNLLIGKAKGFYTNDQNKTLIPGFVMTMPKFSYYPRPVTNTKPHAEITLLDAYKVIKGNRYKARTSELRRILSPLPNGEGSGERLVAASKYKRTHFDYVSFSGVFAKRSDSALVTHSGLLTLDFDHVSNIRELKETLLADSYFETELMFVSPSGNGLKWIIPIDVNQCAHQRWFMAVEVYLKTKYGLEVDKSGKDISRACFLPYDPEVYINPKYEK